MARFRFIRLTKNRLVYLETRHNDNLVRAKGPYASLGWLPRAQLKAKVLQMESAG